MGLTKRAFVCVLCWVLFVELSASCWLAAALADDRASGDGFSAFSITVLAQDIYIPTSHTGTTGEMARYAPRQCEFLFFFYFWKIFGSGGVTKILQRTPPVPLIEIIYPSPSDKVN